MNAPNDLVSSFKSDFVALKRREKATPSERIRALALAVASNPQGVCTRLAAAPAMLAARADVSLATSVSRGLTDMALVTFRVRACH